MSSCKDSWSQDHAVPHESLEEVGSAMGYASDLLREWPLSLMQSAWASVGSTSKVQIRDMSEVDERTWALGEPTSFATASVNCSYLRVKTLTSYGALLATLFGALL